jgi:O-antigen/teichoic acid export membrane protein
VEFVTYTTLAASAVTVGVSIGLLLTGHDVVSLVIVFVAVRYLVLICYFYLINRYIARLHWEFQFAFARSLLHDMKYFAASSLLAALFARPEIIILSLVSTPVQVGLYSAALKLVDLWQIIPETYMINVFPVLSRAFARSDGEPQFIQDKSVKYLLAVALPLGVGMAVAADPIITLLYGPGFEPAVPLLQVLACTIPLYSLNGVLWRVLAARGRQNLVLRVQVITTVTRLAGGVLVIAWLTALGAALITTANLLLYNLLLTPYLRRAGLRLAPWRLSWRFALAAGGMGALLWAGGPYLALWALVPLAALVYGGLVVLLKGFAPDDYALLRRVWHPRATAP